MRQLTVILLIIFVSCGNVKSFDYIIELHGKREIIKSYPISKDKKYLNFILEGTFTDNLGNYGIWDNSSIVTLQNKNVINLQGYGKSIFQNNEIIYTKGFRNKQEQQAGVGKTEVVNASRSLLSLIGMSCTYAVNFYEDNAFLIQKCRITEKQKTVLSNISKKKE
ncbi:MAG: hypothetical protein CM15mP124_4380 [Alphaproteobacteria bacterium]|nr:MAG: hypothetical protein CM15mP124_4380 [Alphaproteobacteria bacterium]